MKVKKQKAELDLNKLFEACCQDVDALQPPAKIAEQSMANVRRFTVAPLPGDVKRVASTKGPRLAELEVDSDPEIDSNVEHSWTARRATKADNITAFDRILNLLDNPTPALTAALAKPQAPTPTPTPSAKKHHTLTMSSEQEKVYQDILRKLGM